MTTARVSTIKSTLSLRVIILLALLITLINGAQDDDDQQQYCTGDGANGVVCTFSSPSIFNLSAALSNYRSRNCTKTAKLDDNNCKDHFENLFISGNLTQLSSISTETDFSGLSFSSVYLYSAAANLVDSVYCSSQKQLSKQIFFGGTSSRLVNEGVRGLLSSCTSLAQVELALEATDSTKLDLCAEKSLQNPSQLEYLIIRPNDDVYQIADFAFDCLFSAQLKVLKLGRNAIKSIAPNAFSIRDQKILTENFSLLSINLDKCQLTDDVLRDVRFDRIAAEKRPVHLLLDNNNLQTLPPFLEGFLDNPLNSSVSLFGNSFNCKRLKPYRWLLANKEKYQSRVWGAWCSSGQALLTLQLYEPKCNWNEHTKEFICLNVTSLTFDIRSEVNYLEEDEINLSKIQLLLVKNCTSIETISRYAFGTFSAIEIIKLKDLPSLSSIRSDAFGTGTQSLTVTGIHQVPLVHILNVVKKQPLLKQLKMTMSSGQASNFQSVPRRAFTSVNSQLKTIEFMRTENGSGQRILSIGKECVFELNSLIYLSLSGLAISELEMGAFDVPSSSTPLELNLTSCNLDETKLLSKPFNNAHRPLNIYLEQNSIHLLLEESFSFLLNKQIHHRVHLEGNPISCKSEPNSNETFSHHYWLYVNREYLKDQVTGARCVENEMNIFEFLETQFGGHSGSYIRASLEQHLTLLFAIFTMSMSLFK